MRKRYIRKDIMLNELENEKLIADCQRCNLSYGEYFRRLLMNENIKEKLSSMVERGYKEHTHLAALGQ